MLVGATATRCHQCGASLTFSLAAASRSLSRMMPSTAPVTYAILGACSLLYGISLLATLRMGGFHAPSGGLSSLFNLGSTSPQVMIRLGASFPLRFDLAQPWRFVTANFLHWSLLHILFNMWVLMAIGPEVEEIYGSARYLFIFVVTGIGGYLLSSFFQHFSAGASASLVGLIGVLLAITTRRRSAGMQALRSQIITWIIYLVIWGFLPGMNVDNMAHLGGGLTGYALGRVMMDRVPLDPLERKHAQWLGWGTALVVFLSFAAMLSDYFRIR